MSRIARRVPAAILFGLVLAWGALGSPSTADAEIPASTRFAGSFWEHWGDGKAELAGYDLRFSRYGHERHGVAVAIFVTETFSHEARVKADPGRHPETDLFPVMKLNLVEDFPTGIYDYNLMTSTFVALTEVDGHPRGTPTKISHSLQEWCGHAWIQMILQPRSVDYTLHSYFDGEGDQQRRFDWPADGFAEDAVLLWARGLAGPFLEPGERRGCTLLRSAKALRLKHLDPGFEPAELSRPTTTSRVRVPAGEFEVEEMQVFVGGEAAWTVAVEAAPPHRIIRWENRDGQIGELTGSARVAYWQENGPGGEAWLEKLGLRPRPPRTP